MPGAVLFNADCNKQVFSSEPWKKFGANQSCRFRRKCSFNSDKWRYQAEG